MGAVMVGVSVCSTQRTNTPPHFSQGGWIRIRMMDNWSESCYPVTAMPRSRVSCPNGQVMGVPWA